MTARFLLILVALAAGGCLDPEQPGNLVPKTVAEDPTLPRIEVNGTLLHAEAVGPEGAPTVIAMHGGPGGDYRALSPLKALVADGYRVVFWDQRGAGLSKRHDGDIYTYALYLEDLRQVIERMASPGQPLVFVGHSWGAMYATWFINEYGDYGGRIRGAILSEPGAFTKVQLEAFMKRLEGSISLTSEMLNDATWSGQFLSADEHARADYMRMLLAYKGVPSEARDPNKPLPHWRSGAIVNTALLRLADRQPFDWTTRLEAFAPRVLFLRGDLNTATPLSQQEELAASYASAEVVTMTGVGHEMIWERPDEYLMHTRAYFRAIGFQAVVR